MEAKVLLGKLALGIAVTLASVLTCRQVERMHVSWPRFKLLAWTGLILTRGGLFVTLFVVLHLSPQSDVVGFYYPQMKGALAGGLPYRDYFTAYAPLFPYIGGAALWLWDSPAAIVLLTLVFEAVGFAAWLGFAGQACRPQSARLAALLYIANVLPMFNTAVDGQNQVWVNAFLGFTILLLWRGRCLASGMVWGSTIATVKILPLIFAPAIWLHAMRRIHWTLGFAALPALVYGTCLWKGLDVLQPLRFEGQEITSGCLPFLLAPFLPTHFPAVVFDGVLALALASTLALAWRRLSRAHPQRCVYLVVLLLFVLLVFSKKAFTNYLVMAWFPICLCVVAAMPARPGLSAGLLGIFGTLALVEPSLWFRWFDRQELVVSFQTCSRAGIFSVQGLHLTVFLVCDAALLGLYVWCAAQAWKLYRAPGSDAIIRPPSDAPQPA